MKPRAVWFTDWTTYVGVGKKQYASFCKIDVIVCYTVMTVELTEHIPVLGSSNSHGFHTPAGWSPVDLHNLL